MKCGHCGMSHSAVSEVRYCWAVERAIAEPGAEPEDRWIEETYRSEVERAEADEARDRGIEQVHRWEAERAEEALDREIEQIYRSLERYQDAEIERISEEWNSWNEEWKDVQPVKPESLRRLFAQDSYPE